MSKVICDVCGTTYPETAAQCPICGCAKNTTAQTVAGDGGQGGEAGYSHVKGGRFSKSNVRRRSSGRAPERRSSGSRQPKKEGPNSALVAIVVILLLAIMVVLGYMAIRVFFPDLGKPDPNQQPDSTTLSTESIVTSEPLDVPCTALTLSRNTIEFLTAGDGYLLDVVPTPADTTDKITYATTNSAVVTVDTHGKITAVGGGQAMIIVTCGDMVAQCQVNCNFGDYVPPTESAPTKPPVQLPEGFVLKLNRKEFSLTEKYPNPWQLFKETDGIKPSDITWTVDDPNVASVDENGVVSAVGKGWTTVRATIGDQTASCKVNVTFDPKPPVAPKYTISNSDVTLYVGTSWASFRLTLSDSEGVNVDVEWTVSDEGYVTINGKTITAVKPTYDLPKRSVTISTTIDDYTYTCTVRVEEPKPTESTEG